MPSLRRCLNVFSRSVAAYLLIGGFAFSGALAGQAPDSAQKMERLPPGSLLKHRVKPSALTAKSAIQAKAPLKTKAQLKAEGDAAKYLYVANFSGNAVSIMDITTRVVVATIPVGNSPSGVAVNADGSKAYAANSYGNSVSFIDVAKKKVSATVHVGRKPSAVVVTTDGSTLYVANEKSNSVSVVSTAVPGVTQTVAVGKAPVALAVNSSGTQVYAVDSRDNDVSIINTSTNRVTKVAVGNNPSGIAVNESGTLAYVTNQDDNTVTVIALSTNATTTVAVGNAPIGVAVNPSGSRVYVANNSDNTVSVIDADSNRVLHTIPVGDSPQGIAVSSRGINVSVANAVDNTISIIDAENNTVTATVPGIGNAPISAAMASGAVTYAYVAGYDSRGGPSVLVLNAADYTHTATIGLSGSLPYAIAASPSGRSVYVTQPQDNTVTPINTTANTAGTPISVGQSPRSIAVSPSGTTLYTANFKDGTVSIVNLANRNQVTSVSIGNYPTGIALDPSGTHAYVTSCNLALRQTGWLSIIDLSNNSVSQPYSSAAGCLEDLKVSPDGSKLYAAQDAGGAGTNFLGFAIPIGTSPTPASVNLGSGLGYSPTNLLVSPSGGRVYITITEPPGYKGSNVAVIDTATNAVSSVYSTFWPQGAALTPAGHQLFVSATAWYHPPRRQKAFNFSIIDTRTLTQIKTVALGGTPLVGVAFATVYPQ